MGKEKLGRGQSAQAEKEARALGPMMCKEGKGVRNFGCLSYDTCLDKAAKSMWSGFTCRDCANYNQKDDECSM